MAVRGSRENVNSRRDVMRQQLRWLPGAHANAVNYGHFDGDP
jgi:hypothetical protein